MASLYLHIPFCEHKCIYCDFYSIAPAETHENSEGLVAGFLQSLEREIDIRAADRVFKTSYDTIFFGGGTPSLLAPDAVASILNRLADRFSVDNKAEITLETNPGTVDLAKLRAFRAAGINRISFGIQSFHENDLKFLTRIHNAEQAKENVRNAFKAGFDNVSFDLIFALPGQSMDAWNSNLAQAVALSPTHISCYSLIVEPNTPLKRMVESKQVALLSVDEDAAMYERTVEFLDRAGFQQYEVSNFARPGYACRHNRSYWNHENYLSFGPSAHSFWNGKRWWNLSNVVGYSDALRKGTIPVAGEEVLAEEQWFDEVVILGLRSEGIVLHAFEQRFRKNLLTEFKSLIDDLTSNGLVAVERDRLRLTLKGYLLCDEICRRFCAQGISGSGRNHSPSVEPTPVLLRT
ncbi:MAG TPA: radical SAM family heme chaperone HemW [Bacteroidota bacterium]|nr:radical SAM family heme chaperone HemW [Bacteroidota bacterium]